MMNIGLGLNILSKNVLITITYPKISLEKHPGIFLVKYLDIVVLGHF